MLPKNVRIVHEDAYAVFPGGEVVSLRHAKEMVKPLLIVNMNEHSPEQVRQIFESGFFRHAFSDAARMEANRRCYDDPVEFHKYFMWSLSAHPGLKAEYEAAPDIAAKTKVLEGYYDSCVQRIGKEKMLKDVAETPKEMAQLSKYFLPVAVGLSRILTWCSKIPRVGRFLVKPALSFGAAVHELRYREDRKSETRQKVIEAFAEMPEFIHDAIAAMGMYVKLKDVIDEKKNTLGLSEYHAGEIILTNQDIANTTHEEVIHQLDSHLGFSEREDWKKAAYLDATPDNEFLQLYYEWGSKASLFEGDAYTYEDIPVELLADMYGMEYDMGISPEDMQEAFPNTYPLYCEFKEQLKKHGKDMAHTEEAAPEAEPALEAGPHFRETLAKRAQGSGGAARSRGELTLPTAPRKSWMGE